jgi:hypothetical protein
VILIGLCGKANSGKDTVASLLPATASISFADPLYAALAEILGVPVDLLRDRDFKEATIPWIGKSPRQMLQTMGTDWGRNMVCSDLWTKIAERRIESGGGFVVVRDVRFDNEARLIRRKGGEVWMVSRPDATTCVPHVSEEGISPDLVSRLIPNKGSLRDLADAVRTASERMVLEGKIKGQQQGGGVDRQNEELN